MMSDVLPDSVYTLREACGFLRISEATARRWLKQGKLYGAKVGRDYRFFGRDLLAAMATGSPSEPGFITDEFLALAGIGRSGLSDVAERHDDYLAEAYRRDT